LDLKLEGKTAIVTGGSRGIGKAVALELAREGVNVAVAARDQEALDETARQIDEELGGSAVAIAYDAVADESVKAMVATAAAALGGIDILVNAAAKPDLPPRPTLEEIDDSAFWGDVNVKVMGYLRCIREVVPHMEARGGGRIVSVGGMSAFLTNSTIGSIRNLSVASLTTSLATELADRNIRLNVVHPGATRTERVSESIAEQATQTGTSESAVSAELGKLSLLGRIVDAAEIAGVVAFLVSTRSIAINGEAIATAGGMPNIVRY
jgi:NAD(P)-dependent dehydrogenase (short-subunit alcohol dehydrogenase family)